MHDIVGSTEVEGARGRFRTQSWLSNQAPCQHLSQLLLSSGGGRCAAIADGVRSGLRLLKAEAAAACQSREGGRVGLVGEWGSGLSTRRLI